MNKKITIRRLLVLASVLGVLCIAGIGLARPGHQKKPDAAPNAGDDSVQVTVTAGEGRLGVSVLQISPELRAHLGATTDRGVLVDSVRADSPAAKAGVRVGDAIIEVDGDATRSATDVLDAMADRKKGDAVTIAVVRDRGRLELTATLADDPGPRSVFGGGRFDANDPRFGRWFRDLPDFGAFGSGNLQQQLEDARRRIDELERRLDKLGPH